MIRCREVVIERIRAVAGRGETLAETAVEAARGVAAAEEIGGVIAATFSNPERFPALSVRVASALGLPAATPAFDVQLACSAYPYALYLAGRLAADTGRRILVIDGDAQLPLVDRADRATGAIFSDACTASVVAAGEGESPFDFLTRLDDAALSCSAAGPIRMDGFRVFSFVATEVSKFLRGFPADGFDWFAPHQANGYMIRQLARTLGLSDRLLTLDEGFLNPGSCSVAMTLAANPKPGSRVLVAGFGAGYSAAAGVVRLSPEFNGMLAYGK